MNNNALPFTPTSFSHAPSGPAVITLYDRGRPIYITAVALGRKWLETFHRSLGIATSGILYHVARNVEHISFRVESTEDRAAASRKSATLIATSLSWFNFPRELRELAGWKIPEPLSRETMLSYAREHCLPGSVRLLIGLLVWAGHPLDLRRLFRASHVSTMEEFVAAWDELVEEGLVEGWERASR